MHRYHPSLMPRRPGAVQKKPKYAPTAPSTGAKMPSTQQMLAFASTLAVVPATTSGTDQIAETLFHFVKEHFGVTEFAQAAPLSSSEWEIVYGKGVWENLAGLRFSFDGGYAFPDHAEEGSVEAYLFPKDSPLARASQQNEGGFYAFPLSVAGKNLGVIWMDAQQPLSQDRLRLINDLCDITAGAMHHHQLAAERQSILSRAAQVRRLGRTITEKDSLPGACALLSQAVHDLLPEVNGVLVSLTGEDADSTRYIFAGTRAQNQPELRLPWLPLSQFDQGVQRRVLTTSKPVLVTNLPEVTDMAILTGTACGPNSSILYVPMVVGGTVIGILQAYCAGRFVPEGEEVLSLLASVAAIAMQNIQGALNLRQEAALLEQTHEMMLDGWIRILSLRDSETEEHTRRVCDITLKIARAIGCAEKDLVHLRRGALLHDIGKIGVPDSILHKTGPLNDEEWKIMRQHPVYAFQLLSAIPNLRPTVDIPYCHHEKWDGTGYPRGLKGEEIPLSARIFSVADVWDALTSYRPYRPAWSEEKALAYVIEEAGKSFDPRVVKVFLCSVLGLDSGLVNSIPAAKTAPLSFYCQFPPTAQSTPVGVV